MNCSEFETLLADRMDGCLSTAQQAELEQHASVCPACSEFMSDVAAAIRFLKGAEEIAPPPELITRIAYQAPMGRLRHPLEKPGILSRFAQRWLQPLLQPKLAMGMAMTILSFAMLEKCTGIQVQHIQPADLNPVRVWDGVEDKVMRTKDRAVKYYENIRLVYEIQSRLKEMQAQQEAPVQPPAKRSARQSGRPDGQDKSPLEKSTR
ncbi:MAG TPA: zf-HC2 domain-containing protein [Bryobacteraceae bacterium]|nr:zf-HC2 domain-containing protein [Bryobacteraceae bacterium]